MLCVFNLISTKNKKAHGDILQERGSPNVEPSLPLLCLRSFLLEYDFILLQKRWRAPCCWKIKYSYNSRKRENVYWIDMVRYDTTMTLPFWRKQIHTTFIAYLAPCRRPRTVKTFWVLLHRTFSAPNLTVCQFLKALIWNCLNCIKWCLLIFRSIYLSKMISDVQISAALHFRFTNTLNFWYL